MLQRLKITIRLFQGGGGESLKAIEQRMEKLADTQNKIQVDAAYADTTVILPEAIANDLGKGAEILWSLSCIKWVNTSLRSYHEKFLEKYGVYRVIPLQELLNEVSGFNSRCLS